MTQVDTELICHDNNVVHLVAKKSKAGDPEGDR